VVHQLIDEGPVPRGQRAGQAVDEDHHRLSTPAVQLVAQLDFAHSGSLHRGMLTAPSAGVKPAT